MADHQLPPAEPVRDGVPFGQVFGEIIHRLNILLASRTLCVPCYIERDRIIENGANPADLAPPTIANVIVDGASQCIAHAKTPLTPPGQTPAGLIIGH